MTRNNPTDRVERESLTARDGEEIAARVNGGDWLVAWHPPPAAPEGKRHGAAGICLVPDGGLVLISNDGEHWELPAGRPEGDESWEQTLRREMLEEACATVVRARLLGFSRGVCTSGHEDGLVLVRSFWRAEVQLAAWEPKFEVAHRRVVPVNARPAHLWMGDGFAPIFQRAFAEAGLA